MELSSKIGAGLYRELSELRLRLLPRDLDRVICDLCAEGLWSLRELALLLNRSPVYLQNTAIKRLLQQGRIRFAHPDEPNHPRQAYVATPTPTLSKSDSHRFDVEQAISIGVND